jgi:hypothetical protein
MLAAAALAAASGAAGASAATITVNTGEDSLIAPPELCTLRRAAVAHMDEIPIGGCPAGTGNDTIVIAVPKVTIGFGSPLSDDNQNVDGDIDLLGEVMVKGEGAVVDGNHIDRVFDVQPGATVKLEDMTVTGGLAHTFIDLPGEGGGGIRNAGTLTVEDVTVTGNATSNGGAATNPSTSPQAGLPGGAGGGIESSGTLTVIDSTITDNTTGSGSAANLSTREFGGFVGDAGGEPGGTGGDGGGIESSGTTTIEGSTIADNTTGGGGTGGEAVGANGITEASSGDGTNGGRATGGPGGRGGNGGGIAVDGGKLLVTGSLIEGNTTGLGGVGGAAFGGTGGNGAANNILAGSGGWAIAGDGGSGGAGGGISVSAPAESATVASDTIVSNLTGGGGGGGRALGGNGGTGSSISQTRGFGGNAESGSGGNGGRGGGGIAIGLGPASVKFLGDTVIENKGSEVLPFSGQPGAGQGKVTDGTPPHNGVATFGEFGQFGTEGGIASAVLQGSILADNTPSQCNALTIVEHAPAVNLSYPEGGCEGVVADPKLGLLADNGGPTKTFALLPGSPAIDEVPAGSPGCPAADQRGVARPRGGACDAGAYEIAAPEAVTGGATVTTTTATIEAAVNPEQRATSVQFTWGPQGGAQAATAAQSLAAGNVGAPITAALTGLTPATTYTYEVTATNADGTSSGAERTFTTAAAPSSSPGPPPSPPGLHLSRLRLKPDSFRPVAPGHRRHRGTVVSWDDSGAATVTFTVERRAGKKARVKKLKGSLSHRDKAGADKLRWNGRLHGKALPAGRYLLVAHARLGGASATVSHAFKVLPARG